MKELIFVTMFIIKELIGVIARKRQQLHLLPVRRLLILSCLMLIHLVWHGILDDWLLILRMFVIVSLISDIVRLVNNKIDFY